METTLISESGKKRRTLKTTLPEVNVVRYKTQRIDSLDIFYREAGSAANPTILLLHGFPASSHMFRNLMVALSGKYHLIAPDYPGFGNSSMPLVKDFEYSFDHLAEVVDKFIKAIHLNKFSIYIMDYGAPVGFRLALKHPDKIQSVITQNGNAYEEGLSPFWDHMRTYWKEPKKEVNINFIRDLLTSEGTKSQYLNGARDVSSVSPDSWIIDQAGLDRPGNSDIQLQLFYSYRTNVESYPKWQEYLRKYQPPVLAVWGKNDEIFPASGAEAFRKDVKNAEIHLLDTGHFALEEDVDTIARLIDEFLVRNNIYQG